MSVQSHEARSKALAKKIRWTTRCKCVTTNRSDPNTVRDRFVSQDCDNRLKKLSLYIAMKNVAEEQKNRQ